MRTLAQRVAADLERAGDGLMFVITGAGISVASGIPTFRGSDPGAIWKRDVTALGTFEYFSSDPVGSWSWYLERFDKVLGAEPNPAHQALARLERWQRQHGGDFLLVTQNIDTLHEAAGSEQLIKVHGSADRVRCSRQGCRHGAPRGSLPRSEVDIAGFRADPSRDTLPRCPECDSVLRQHVLWFDEYYQGHDDYRWSEVVSAIDRMHVALCVGTSFSVGVTEMVLRGALLNGVPLISVDPGESTVRASGIQHIQAPAEVVLPEALDELGLVS
jgi:NAD-dependent deacetylase